LLTGEFPVVSVTSKETDGSVSNPKFVENLTALLAIYRSHRLKTAWLRGLFQHWEINLADFFLFATL